MREELWNEVCNTVQETMTKTIPQGNEMEEAKVVVCGGLRNSLERRETKGRGERKRCTQLNAEFQRIARR